MPLIALHGAALELNTTTAPPVAHLLYVARNVAASMEALKAAVAKKAIATRSSMDSPQQRLRALERRLKLLSRKQRD